MKNHRTITLFFFFSERKNDEQILESFSGIDERLQATGASKAGMHQSLPNRNDSFNTFRSYSQLDDPFRKIQ